MQVDLLLKTLFLQSPDDNSLSGNLADPLTKFLEKNELHRFAKSGVGDESWNAPVSLPATSPATFPERSRERFSKVCAAIRKVFGNSPEYEQAITLATTAFDEERAAVLLAASGAPLAKGEITSRMFSLMAEIRQDCTADEIKQLEKAARALDAACFMEIAEGVIARARQAA